MGLRRHASTYISNIHLLVKMCSTDGACCHNFNSVSRGRYVQGLPHQTVTWWFPMPSIGRMIGLAIKVCAIDVLESISIAKALAYRNQYELKCASASPCALLDLRHRQFCLGTVQWRCPRTEAAEDYRLKTLSRSVCNVGGCCFCGGPSQSWPFEGCRGTLEKTAVFSVSVQAAGIARPNAHAGHSLMLGMCGRATISLCGRAICMC